MKNLKKLPFILAFAVTIFASSCGEDTAITPTRTDDDNIPPPPPPPRPAAAVYSDSTTVELD